jgi:hypothetical protein
MSFIKRSFLLLLLSCTLLAVLPAPGSHAARVRRHPHVRTRVVVHRGWPLRRPARVVVIRPHRHAIRVMPVRYLPAVMFVGVVLAVHEHPAHEVLVWEDAETLEREEGWTEFSLSCDQRGTRLWLEVERGRVQFDWAEVVFENGDTQVVDFQSHTQDEGLYSLLDFRDGRRVDHVRIVARARSETAQVALRLER